MKPDVALVYQHYPKAIWASDIYGWYIMSDNEVVGTGRTLSKAWADTLKRIYQPKKKRGRATRL